MEKKLKIDGKEYELSSLDEETKAHVISVQAVDRRIQDVTEQLAILKTARIGYATQLKKLMEKEVEKEVGKELN